MALERFWICSIPGESREELAASKVHAGNAGLQGAPGKYAYKVVGIPSAEPLPCCGSADVLLFPLIQRPVPRT